MMQRIPEPELMNDSDQARAYAQADFDEPNSRFVDTFASLFGAPDGCLLDLGCGPGDIMLRFARRFPALTLHGVDGSDAMLALAHEATSDAGLADRLQYLRGRIPDAALPRDCYDGVISNSLLHHLHDPAGLWHTIRRYAAPGAPILVMDLTRPPSVAAATDIVDTYAGGEPEVLRHDFHCSLLAAFTPGEVRRQLREAGLEMLEVQAEGDRHMLISGRMPE